MPFINVGDIVPKFTGPSPKSAPRPETGQLHSALESPDCVAWQWYNINLISSGRCHSVLPSSRSRKQIARTECCYGLANAQMHFEFQRTKRTSKLTTKRTNLCPNLYLYVHCTVTLFICTVTWQLKTFVRRFCGRWSRNTLIFTLVIRLLWRVFGTQAALITS